MHGLTRNSADFEALAGHLSGQYQLIVPDQRGRGRSEYDPDPENYTPAVYVQDMFALIDGLRLAKLGLIGTSLGGLMAMMMAAISPARRARTVRQLATGGRSMPVRTWRRPDRISGTGLVVLRPAHLHRNARRQNMLCI